jgi:hypothetical protein
MAVADQFEVLPCMIRHFKADLHLQLRNRSKGRFYWSTRRIDKLLRDIFEDSRVILVGSQRDYA